MSAVPLSLATFDGKLRKSNKAQLMHILEKDATSKLIKNEEKQVGKIIDGMALVQCINVTDVNNFGDFSDK